MYFGNLSGFGGVSETLTADYAGMNEGRPESNAGTKRSKRYVSSLNPLRSVKILGWFLFRPYPMSSLKFSRYSLTATMN